MPPPISTTGRSRKTRVLRSDTANAAESTSSRTADSTQPPPTAITTSTPSTEEITVQVIAEMVQKQTMKMEKMMLKFSHILKNSQQSSQPASSKYASPISIGSDQSNDVPDIHPNNPVRTATPEPTNKPRRLEITNVPAFKGTASEDVDM
ncbi:uncharacterized protein VTP21DRAFT_9049 [Calcarisporiella thermophila]|uniref:uncharacterized protein n=1 Tax=Calcarisporiella thermophila TaxID=911321 RepID=UPI0037435BD3